MKLLLVVSIVSCTAAFPLDEELFEGSGAIAAFQDNTKATTDSLEGSGGFDEDLESSGADVANLVGSGETDADVVLATEFALAASEDILVQSRSAPGSSKARSASNISKIMSQTSEHNNGSFSYGYRTSDGTSVETFGKQKRIGDGVGIVMRGSYYYVAPNGKNVKITWVADENGFRAFGDAVPKAPTYVADLLKRTADVEENVADAEGSGVDAEEDLDFDEIVTGDAKIVTDHAGSFIVSEDDASTSPNDTDADSTAEDALTADGTAPVAVKTLLASNECVIPSVEDVEVGGVLDEIDTTADDVAVSEAVAAAVTAVNDKTTVAVADAVSDDVVPAVTATAGEEDGEATAAGGETSLADQQHSSDGDTSGSAGDALGALEILARFS